MSSKQKIRRYLASIVKAQSKVEDLKEKLIEEFERVTTDGDIYGEDFSNIYVDHTTDGWVVGDSDTSDVAMICTVIQHIKKDSLSWEDFQDETL